MATNHDELSVADAFGIALTTGQEAQNEIFYRMITSNYDDNVDEYASNYMNSMAYILHTNPGFTVSKEKYDNSKYSFISPEELYKSVDRAYSEMEKDCSVSYMQSCNNPFDEAVFRVVRIKYITDNAKPNSHLFDGIDTQYSGIGFYTTILDDILDNLGNGTIEKREIYFMQGKYNKETLEYQSKENSEMADDYRNALILLYHYDNKRDYVYYEDILGCAYILRRDYPDEMKDIDIFTDDGWFLDVYQPTANPDTVELRFNKKAIHEKMRYYYTEEAWDTAIQNWQNLKDGLGISHKKESNPNLDKLKGATTIFNSSKFAVVPVYRDPLMLDLDGNGLDITAKADGAHFDLDKNGFAERMNWSNTDGFLCLDLNGNGKIDDGGELFGDQTVLADGTNAKICSRLVSA